MQMLTNACVLNAQQILALTWSQTQDIRCYRDSYNR